MPTLIFKNTSKKTLIVEGVGEVEAGQQVSVTSDYPTPIRLENYPGLVNITDEEKKNEK